MPDSIDWPRIQSPRRRRRFLLLILAVLAVIFFGGRTALSYYVDVLWFGSLGYRDVLWKTLSLQWGIFAAFAAATFLILFGVVAQIPAPGKRALREQAHLRGRNPKFPGKTLRVWRPLSGKETSQAGRSNLFLRFGRRSYRGCPHCLGA